MHHFATSLAASVVCLSTASSAFVIQPRTHVAVPSQSTTVPASYTEDRIGQSQRLGKLYLSKEEDESEDNEIERLKAMAATLRADAARLEAEKAQSLADAAEKAFREFDTNQDGEISLQELKAGLEKALKTELSDSRVEALMKVFDASGDGALQLEDFVTIDKFRNQLEALAREEKLLAAEAAKQAKLDAEAAALAEARLEILNEKPPTNSDKLVSVLPYLFPLMDGLQYGRFLLQGEDGSNPLVAIVAILYTLYRSIPLSGFIAFFVLNIFSNNPSLNRLVRFNMQQAIFLDIALFFPALLGGISGLVLGGMGQQIPNGVTQLGTDGIFIALLLTLAYCSVSSLLGFTPDKVPLVSQAVSDRMPTIDMFDAEGRFLPREFRDDDEAKKESDEDKKSDK